MSESVLDISDFLRLTKNFPVIDVRTPAEYEHAHIPGAINLPLFSNEERSVIGTLYVQKGSSQAIMKGLEIIGPRIKELAERAGQVVPGNETLMHCWRGGMRSNSMAWLLNTAGIKSHVLQGGYKSYRRYLHQYFEKPFNFIVIGGMTGSGKSDLLEKLDSEGAQVIHLEKLAHHKGSVFGGIGMPGQPSTEQFENDLFTCLYELNIQKPIFIEDESIAIGEVFIPRAIYDQMASARFITLEVSKENRIKQLMESYTECDPQILINSVKRIEKRLGLETAARIIDCIRNNEMELAIDLILVYYDKLYEKSMNKHKRKESVKINNNDLKENVPDKIKQIYL